MQGIERYTQIAEKIEDWFVENAREFPWRTLDTPWGRLCSEFMAQQTQITRVAERWPPLMERFFNPQQHG